MVRGRADRSPGKTLGGSRDGQQRQDRGDKAQGRIEPRQTIIEPNEPIRSHVHQPIALWINDGIVVPHLRERNLECPNPAFAELEGCRQFDAERVLLTFTPILQFFSDQQDLAQAGLAA